MKKFTSLFIMMMILISTYAQDQLPKEMQQFFQKKNEAYFKVFLNSAKDVHELSDIVDVDNFDGELAIAYANQKQFEKFSNLGFPYELLPNPSSLIDPKMFHGEKDTYEWDTYPTYDAYVAMMNQFAADYPDICEVFSIGNSVEGRELLFVKISDNVSQNEAEPQFLYTGTMHGDETAGYVLLLRLIDYLTVNYGTDAEVTDLVNGMEIWINPAANPDGTYHGGNNTVNGSTRYNANGIDLNRNYPDPREGAHPDGNAWQAETVAFMQIAEDNNFVMAANTHGGTEVVNYPWDTWHRLTADDDWWQMVSHEYADTAQFFSPPSYFDGFNDGITNGAAWYVITGGRQDYMNYFQGCREVTLELSHIHTLPESQLDAHWTYNKRSLINYIKQTYYGVRGIITDSITGEPLLAKVEVLSHDMDESHIYSREGQGNYHRLLKTGTYDLKYSKDGYFPKTFYGVVVNDYDSTVLNVELVAAALTADFTADDTSVSLGSDVNFTQQCFGDPDTYEWTFEGGDPATSSEVNPVVTYDEKGSYDVSLTITKGADIQSITKEDYIEVNEEFLMSDSEVTICSGLFMDDGGDGDYSNSKDYTMTFIAEDQSENVVLSAEFLEFDVEFQETCNYDYLKIYDGPNASSTLIGTYCGTDSPGTVFSSNTEKALTFVFHSDNTEVASGWKAMINCSIPQSINELSTNQITIFPNPTEDGFLTIKSTIFMEEVRVVNMNGQVLTSFTSLGKEEYLDLSFLETGIYILTITTDYGVSHQKIQIR